MKYLISSLRFKHLLLLFLPLMLMVYAPAPSSATVLSTWPDWKNHKRELKVYIPPGADAAFKAKVNAAIAAWNTANANNGWSMSTTSTESEADVTIQEGDPGGDAKGDYAGLATPVTEVVNGNKVLKRVDIVIDEGMTDAETNRTIMHELGHCFRMAHTDGANDVLNESNTATTPSTMDTTETRASDLDTSYIVVADSNVSLGDANAPLAFYPSPESGMTFDEVVDVNITSLTGDDFFVDPASITISPDEITCLITVQTTAAHNEVFNLELIDEFGNSDNYPGILTVTPPGPTPTGLPHAVAGSDIIVAEGQPVTLDGSGSFHDAAGVFFDGYWLIPSANTGLFHDRGQLYLPPGTHEATLTVYDYYGRTDIDTLTIHVAGPENPIPTLSEWGIILFALLLLAFGVVFIRKRQLAVGGSGSEFSGQATQAWITKSMLRRFPLTLLIVLMLVSTAIFIIYGEITSLDVSGIVISSIILTYIYHYLRIDKSK